MNGARVIMCNVICLMTLSRVTTRAEDFNDGTETKLQTRANDSRSFEIFPGVELLLAQDEIRVKLRIRKLFGDSFTSARHSDDEDDSKMIPFKKIGTMLMMMPIAIQVLSIPGAVASIKMSLIRSIFVAKLAIALMIYNAIKNSQRTEVVVIRQPEHHEHYYDAYRKPEDDHEGWLKKWV